MSRKNGFQNLIAVNDFGLEKSDNMDKISLVFGTTLGTILRALCCE